MKENKKREIVFLIIFFTGFLVGILFINLWGDTYFIEKPLLSRENLLRIKNTVIEENSLFFYLLGLRMKWYLILWLVGYTIAGLPAALLVLGWLGFAGGTLLTMGVIQFGLAAIPLLLSAVLPQGMIYVSVVVMVVREIYEKGKPKFRNRLSFQGWKQEKEYMLVLITGLVLLALGAALEAYANPWLMKQAINYFL